MQYVCWRGNSVHALCYLFYMSAHVQVKLLTSPQSSNLRWVFMSTSSTKRHIDIMGSDKSEAVQTANTLVARFVLLTLVAVCRGCFWVVAWLIIKYVYVPIYMYIYS